MRVDLDGKVALVTGAARGIGQAIADLFATNGARVVYTDIDLPALQVAAARQSGAPALELDVTDADRIDEVLRRVVQQFGRLDVLVNNAGVNTLAHRVNIDE